jgi:membrane associated rhomboid family serine protease
MIPLHDDNPTHMRPVLTVTFIVVAVLAFLWQISLGQAGGQRAVFSLGVIPAVLFNKADLPPDLAWVPPAATVFTSMFLHGGFMHLAGNMLYLWIFGNNVEDSMGHLRFIVFYLLCGAIAAVGQALINPASEVPMIGASGAISGVLGAYLLLYPHARVLTMIPLGFYAQMVRLPALAVLGLWFVLQIASSAMANNDQGGVAWFAHIGGFVAGMALIPLFKRRDVRLFHPAQPAAVSVLRNSRW